MRLLLIRHGQTRNNVARLLDTAVPGAPLNDLGLSQADALVETLGHRPIEVLVASTLTRSQQTAAPLAAHLGIEPWIRDGIREIAAGDAEMLGGETHSEAYVRTITAWASGDVDLRMPGGETGAEFFARFDEVVAEVIATGAQTAALVGHAAALRCWSGRTARNVNGQFIAPRAIANTGVLELEGDADGWTLLSWEGRSLDDPELVDGEGFQSWK